MIRFIPGVVLVGLAVLIGCGKADPDSPKTAAPPALEYASADDCRTACDRADELQVSDRATCLSECGDWSPAAARCLSSAGSVEAAQRCETERYEESKAREATVQGINEIERKVRTSYIVEVELVFVDIRNGLEASLKAGNPLPGPVALSKPSCKPVENGLTDPTWAALEVSHDSKQRYVYGLARDGLKLTLQATGDVDCDEKPSRFEQRCEVQGDGADRTLSCGPLEQHDRLE